MTDYRDLKVWQKAHALMLLCDQHAASLQGPRYSSLRSQLRRAAESIPTNIVESRGHESSKEEIRFLRMALNSSSELEYHVLVGRDLGGFNTRQFERLTADTVEVRKMLYGLIRYLRERGPPS